MKLEVFTDGSATTSDKPGGYGYVIVIDGEKYLEGSGHLENASNNDAELQAAIEGLKKAHELITKNSEIFLTVVDPAVRTFLVSDSQLVLGWADGRYAFKQENKRDKYKELKLYMGLLNAKTQWVEGHTGNEFNERCDKLANIARKSKEVVDVVEEKKITPKPVMTNSVGKICVWYQHQIKVIDLEKNEVQNYNQTIHGSLENLLKVQ